MMRETEVQIRNPDSYTTLHLKLQMFLIEQKRPS
jgi:hypothetical protein